MDLKFKKMDIQELKKIINQTLSELDLGEIKLNEEKRFWCSCPGFDGPQNCYHPCDGGCCSGGAPTDPPSKTTGGGTNDSKALKQNKKMNKKELEEIIRETLSKIDLKEKKIYYVCDASGDTFTNDSTCGGGCPEGDGPCKEANTGMVGTGGNIQTTKGKTKTKVKKKKMAKQDLKERFSQLAGIKPLYEMDDKEMESTKEITKEELMNEGPELWTALGGLVGLIGAAGITTQLQMMAEDPAIAEKYPKLEKIFTFLAKVGGAVGSGIK